MRIVHIVCSYPPYYGGMGNVALQTVSELERREHDVTVLTPLYKSLETPEYKAGIEAQKTYAKRLTPSISYGNAARLPTVHEELEEADIVHLHYPFFGTAELVRAWKKKHPTVPLVVTYHMDTRGTGWKGLFFKWYATFWMPRILKSADLLIASSEDYILASDAADVYKQTKETWMTLPFGVDTERFQPRSKPTQLFVEHGLSLDMPTVLFVGGMDPAHAFKGIPVLLEALLLLKRAGKQVQAVFVGDGSLREGFELKAKGFGIGSLVRFVGKVSDAELPSYYNMADALVLPSVTQAEAFGMVLLEAMASGVPVIASDLPGVRSVAKQGGHVFPPGDSAALAARLVEFFSESTDRVALSQEVRRVAETEYAWPQIVDRLEREYKRLVRAMRI